MHRIECRAWGPPESLLWCEAELPTPGPGEVRISVDAAGVNFVDALFVAGTYQVRIPPPFVPGGEFAGRIDAIGDQVTGFVRGDLVMAQTGVGAFAEAVVCPADRVTRLAPGTDPVQAAAFQLTYATALYALRERGSLAAGETVLVLAGAGGVGSAAIDVARQPGSL